MTSHTDYRLAEIDDGHLEKLAIDLLTRTDRYRGVDPQGGRGKDGGKDGLLLDGSGGENVIIHVSRRKDWPQKLEEDLRKAADHDRDYGTFVYVTNQTITGNQKPVPDVAEPFVDEHGWEIDIWDGERLRSELDNNHQDLRRRYLDIAVDEDPSEKAARVIDERLSLIRRRADEFPRQLQDGPVAVLHLIPHGAVDGDDEFRHDELPIPTLPGRYGGYSHEKTLDGRVSFATSRAVKEFDLAYAYVDVQGWFEAVDAFIGHGEEKTIAGESFEKLLGDAYESGRETLTELGLDGPFEVGLSVLSLKGYSFATKKGGFGRTGPKEFQQNDIEAKPYTVENADAMTGEAMKRAFGRVWRGARWSNGSPYYSENGWHFER